MRSISLLGIFLRIEAIKILIVRSDFEVIYIILKYHRYFWFLTARWIDEFAVHIDEIGVRNLLTLRSPSTICRSISISSYSIIYFENLFIIEMYFYIFIYSFTRSSSLLD